MSGKIRFGLFTACLILMFTGCAGTEEKKPAERPFVADAGADGVQRIEITGGSYWFEPGHIIVQVDRPVELVAKTARGGLIEHTLVMDSPDAGMDFRITLSTRPKTVRFTPVKAGKYPFYCDKKFLFFPSHREQGMEGTLEVVEELP